MVGTLVMAPKSVTFRRHDHLVSVLFGDLLSHSYNITFLYLVEYLLASIKHTGATIMVGFFFFFWQGFYFQEKEAKKG